MNNFNNNFNLIENNLICWNWESEIISIEEIILTIENKINIKIKLKNIILNNLKDFLLNGSRSQRPLLCIEGYIEYSGLWRAYNIENDIIYCTFSHLTSTCSNLWNLKYYLFKTNNHKCGETNLQLLSETNVSNIKKIYLAPPLVFHTRISIFNIDAIDTVNQTFRADIYAELRLKYITNSEDKEAIEKLLECYQANILTIDFLNVAEIIGEKEIWSNFDLNHPGEPLDYVIKVRLKAQFIERMELENFPFDIQDLNIPITLNSSINRVALRPNYKYPSVFQVILVLLFYSYFIFNS